MKRLRWHDYLILNVQWFGISTATGCITPVLLPYLVALFAPPDRKNTYLSAIRIVSLAVAMSVQPMAGLLSDRNTSRWGRRRPYIAAGTLASVLCLGVIGVSPLLGGASLGGQSALFPTRGAAVAYLVLMAGIVLWQAAANVAQGPLQAFIPDLVPVDQRGRASGVKAVLELSAALPIIVVGPIIDAGRIWLALGLIAAALLVPLAITLLWVREAPLAREERPAGAIGGRLARLLALTAIFVAVTQLARWAVSDGATALTSDVAATPWLVVAAGMMGLVAMAGVILLGVYGGVRAGIGREARRHRSFTWWVVNRLLFLAAMGSLQGFVLYFLRDVYTVADAATLTARLAAVVAAFVIPAAVGGGYLADRLGRRRLVALAGLAAAGGTFVLVATPPVPVLYGAVAVLGMATGLFAATGWALGTDLVPASEAGRYLGVANLAGAGAGIVGAGIGGPLADAVNAVAPGSGYLAIFGAYGVLFVLSAAVMTQVRRPAAPRGKVLSSGTVTRR